MFASYESSTCRGIYLTRNMVGIWLWMDLMFLGVTFTYFPSLDSAHYSQYIDTFRILRQLDPY